MRTALIVGATGLIGRALLARLAIDPDYRAVVALVRRPLENAPAKVRAVVVDFDAPESYRAELAVDDVFCCLGTTIKKAGSAEAFTRVDLEIPLAIAKESLAAGAKRYLVVTAVGSNATSGILYNRVKGNLENALQALPFADGVKVFRPSLLLGERDEARLGEQVGSVVMAMVKPLLFGGLQRYRAIRGDDVARAMVNAAKTTDAGFQVYEGADLFEMAARGA